MQDDHFSYFSSLLMIRLHVRGPQNKDNAFNDSAFHSLR